LAISLRIRAFSDGEFSASAMPFVRNWSKNVRTPVVLSFDTSSDARSSNSLSQPDCLSSEEKLIGHLMRTSRPLESDRLTPEKSAVLGGGRRRPPARAACVSHWKTTRQRDSRRSPKTVDRNLKNSLWQCRNPDFVSHVDRSAGHTRECRSFCV